MTAVRWRLAEILARHGIKNKDFAEALGVGPNAASSLKTSETMPRLDGERLGEILDILNQMGKPELMENEAITILDLLEYKPEKKAEC